ncbi:MAG: terminase [Terriglobales bacterium]
MRGYLEALGSGQPEDKKEAVCDFDAGHSENGIDRGEDNPKAGRTRAARRSSEKEMGKLLELGNQLDEITPLRSQFRKIDSTEDFPPEEMDLSLAWKPTQRDAWIEEFLFIRSKVGEPGLIRLNPVQREYARVCLAEKSHKNIVLKARQVGITSYIAARFFVQTVTRKGALTMLVAHNRLAAEEIFRIVHRFWNRLPDEIRKGPLKTSHSSARELVFPELDSAFSVTAADENTGRGRTIQNLHCTEVSRWGREGEDALASMRAALVPGGEIVLESTANGAWGTFYQEWQRAKETGYTQHFFPWWFETSYRCEVGPSFVMTSEEAQLADAHRLTVEQIGWRRQQWSTLRRMAAQEFAEDAVACFRASGECVFELVVVEKALEAAGEPVELLDNGRLAIWLPARPGIQYLIGVDPAGGGVKGDYSCAQVIDRKMGMQCAELHGHFSLRELARKLVDLGNTYNSAVLAVERNNHGAGVLAHLERMEYPAIYEEKGWNGWNTTALSRPAMIETLVAVMMEAPELFRSARLWNECRTFRRVENGRPEAAAGSHDDCVMAMGIALAVREGAAGCKGKRETLWRREVRSEV